MNFLANLLNSGANYRDNSRQRFRLNFINVLLILAAPLFILYAIVNAFASNYLIMSIDSVIAVILILTFIYLRSDRNIAAASTVLLILILFINFTMMFSGGGLYGSAFVWFFFFPLMSILLKGNRKGIPWIMVHISVIFGYFLYLKISQTPQNYDPEYLVVLSIALILESIMIIYYERVRQSFDRIIIRQNRELQELKLELENRVEHETEKNSRLSSELFDMQNDIIFTMGTIGEKRALETDNHVKRVAAYTRLLGSKYGLDEESVMMLEQASSMHDIGKVAISETILLKPDKLNDQEFEIIKSHAELGFNMLKNSHHALLQMAATIAHQHHEYYDGSGYPQGLKGKEIDIFARITALADVFEALGHDRIYQKAWSDEKICTYIKARSGIQFDPKLVDIFFKHIDRFLEIKDQYKE